MFTRIIALLMIVSLIGCSTAPHTGLSASDQGAPAVSSTDTDKPASRPDAEQAPPAKMDPTAPASEPAETPPDHGKELAKAGKVAGKIVIGAVVVVLVVAIAAAYTVASAAAAL